MKCDKCGGPADAVHDHSACGYYVICADCYRRAPGEARAYLTGSNLSTANRAVLDEWINPDYAGCQ